MQLAKRLRIPYVLAVIAGIAVTAARTWGEDQDQSTCYQTCLSDSQKCSEVYRKKIDIIVKEFDDKADLPEERKRLAAEFNSVQEEAHECIAREIDCKGNCLKKKGK
jgi:hypothetical protein